MQLKRFTSEVALLNSVLLSLENDLQIAPFGFLKSRKLTLKIIMMIMIIFYYSLLFLFEGFENFFVSFIPIFDLILIPKLQTL